MAKRSNIRMQTRIKRIMVEVFPHLDFTIEVQRSTWDGEAYVWVEQNPAPQELGGWSWTLADVEQNFPKAIRNLIRWTDSWNGGPKYVGLESGHRED